MRRQAAREVLSRPHPLPGAGTEVHIVNALEVTLSATEVIRMRLDALRQGLLDAETIRDIGSDCVVSARTPSGLESG